MIGPSIPGSEVSRRQFLLGAIPSFFLLQLASRMANSAIGTFGIAYGSFDVRTRQLRMIRGDDAGPVLPADKFIDLCRSFGGDGCQMDFSQLVSTEPAYLRRLRQACEEKNMFLELSLDSSLLENAEQFTRLAEAARQLGVSRLSAALGRRRDETYAGRKPWQEKLEQWKKSLQAIEPILKQQQLLLGLVNNQDWRAVELSEFLRQLGSPQVGACVDFCNSLSLLEDPLETVQILAPLAVTSRMKDAAIGTAEDGFVWSQVPLGDGILPLAKILELLRRSRADIHFCLEMVTADPISVPYMTDRYWASWPGRDAALVEKFQSTVLSKASPKPLPKVSGMSSARLQAVEDENLRRSVSYSKRTLGL